MGVRMTFGFLCVGSGEQLHSVNLPGYWSSVLWCPSICFTTWLSAWPYLTISQEPITWQGWVYLLVWMLCCWVSISLSNYVAKSESGQGYVGFHQWLLLHGELQDKQRLHKNAKWTFPFGCLVVELFTHVNCSHWEWFHKTILQCKGNIVSQPKIKAGKKGSSQWLEHQMVENQQIHLQRSSALTSSVSESDQDKKLYSLPPIPGCLMAMCFPLKGQRSCGTF